MAASIKFFASLPVFHIGICYWYIFCFHAGFGGGSFNLVSATDVFSVSIGKLAAAYIGLLSALAISHSILAENPSQLPSDGNLKLHSYWNSHSAGLLMQAMFWIALASLAALVLFFKIFISGFAVVFAGFFIGSLCRQIKKNNSFDENRVLAGGILLFCMLNLSIFAYRDGFSLRNGNLDSLPRDRLVCNDYSPYCAVGENFIGVSANGMRLVVNENCEKLFEFSQSTVVVDMM